MTDFIWLAFNGLGGQEFMLSVLRIAVGVFFFISGYHKLWNATRHASMRATLVECGIPCVSFFEWFVSGVEFIAGIAVMVGLFTPLAAFGLLVICLVALCTDGPKRVASFKPLDPGDRLDDWLYLPEALLALVLLVLIAGGGGPISVDSYIRLWLF